MRLFKKQFILYLCFSVFLFIKTTSAISQTKANSVDPFIVVLDAGHGGKDSGNRGNGYYEKKIALEIALKTGSILKKTTKIKVIYTRKTDVFIDLIERAKIANKVDADLFVSIHCDSHDSQAFGAGTFVLGLHANQRNFEIAQKENSVIFYEDNYEEKYDGFDPNNPEAVIGLTLMQEAYLNQSILAADAIQKSFVNNLKRKDRRVKQAGFVVLKYTYMPSVLVETGFLTNKREGAYLNSLKGQTQMAEAIAKAITNYQKSLKLSINNEVTMRSSEPKTTSKSVDEIKKENNNEIVFKVQIAAGYKPLKLKPYNFKGLTSISRSKEGTLYRYYYGSTSSYSKINELKEKAISIGFENAFIVAFKNGKKVKLSTVTPN